MIELKITADSAGELAEQLKGLADTMAGKPSKKQEVSKVIPTASNAAPKEEPKVDPTTEEKPITKTVENSDAEAHPILAELAKTKSMAEAYELLVAKQIESSKGLLNSEKFIQDSIQEKVKAVYPCASSLEVDANFAVAFMRSWFKTQGVNILKDLKGVENTPENVNKYVALYNAYCQLLDIISIATTNAKAEFEIYKKQQKEKQA